MGRGGGGGRGDWSVFMWGGGVVYVPVYKKKKKKKVRRACRLPSSARTVEVLLLIDHDTQKKTTVMWRHLAILGKKRTYTVFSVKNKPRKKMLQRSVTTDN